MKDKFLFLIIAALFAVWPVSSEPLDDLVGTGYASQLRSTGSVTESQLKAPVPRLLPNHELLKQFVSGIITVLKPSLAVETLYLYEKSGSNSTGWTDVQRTGLFNQMTAISTLSGIQYYSVSRKSMRTFYESSLVIDGPQTKKPLPDPKFPIPPETLTVYARQKDLTFGDNIYRYDYKTTEDAFFFSQDNMTSLSYGIIPVVGKNKLRSVMAVIDCGDYLLIYAVSMADATTIFGMGDRVSSSFSNRAEAIFKWFCGRADTIFF
jgi:hypothetical protein